MSSSGGRFEFFDHTGDIGVRLHGLTPGDVFAAAAGAFADSITDPRTVEPRSSLTIHLEAAALDLLLVDFLAELLYRFEVDEFVPVDADAEIQAGQVCTLHATVRGERFDPDRHPSKVLIKAVTYHALDVRRDPTGYHATVVFDI